MGQPHSVIPGLDSNMFPFQQNTLSPIAMSVFISVIEIVCTGFLKVETQPSHLSLIANDHDFLLFIFYIYLKAYLLFCVFISYSLSQSLAA